MRLLCGLFSSRDANYDASVAYAGNPTGTKLDKTVTVGSYRPNAFGLYDVHGNVWEWVEDCWNDTYARTPTDGSASTALFCLRGVLRGGSWKSKSRDLRSAVRGIYYPSNQFNADIGLRVARTN